MILFAVPLTGASAQPNVASPRDTTRAKVGAAEVMIDYGRPSKRGRVIFGGLQPFGQVWRTGANAATTLITDKSLRIGGLAVPAGRYTLYTIPDQTSWKLIINKQTGQWGTEYRQDQDLGRVDMTVTTLPEVVEKFAITIEGGTLRLAWDKTAASVPISAAAN
jgi:hypothetical protein